MAIIAHSNSIFVSRPYKLTNEKDRYTLTKDDKKQFIISHSISIYVYDFLFLSTLINVAIRVMNMVNIR